MSKDLNTLNEKALFNGKPKIVASEQEKLSEEKYQTYDSNNLPIYKQKELEQRKLKLELDKLEFDKTKAELEAEKAQLEVIDLKRGFLRRSNAPALISMIATLLGLFLGAYVAYIGIQKLELQDLEGRKKDAETKAKDAETKASALESNNIGLKAETAKLEQQFDDTKQRYKNDISTLIGERDSLNLDLTKILSESTVAQQKNSFLESVIGQQEIDNKRLKDVEKTVLANIEKQKLGLKEQSLDVMKLYLDICLTESKFDIKYFNALFSFYNTNEEMQNSYKNLFRSHNIGNPFDPNSDQYRLSASALILYRVTRDPIWKDNLDDLARAYITSDRNNAQIILTDGITWLLPREDHIHFRNEYISLGNNHIENIEIIDDRYEPVLKALGLIRHFGRDEDLILKTMSKLRYSIFHPKLDASGKSYQISDLRTLSRISPTASLTYTAKLLSEKDKLNGVRPDKLIEYLDALLGNNSNLAQLVPGYLSASSKMDAKNLKTLKEIDWKDWLEKQSYLTNNLLTNENFNNLKNSQQLFESFINTIQF